MALLRYFLKIYYKLALVKLHAVFAEFVIWRRFRY